MKRGRTARRRRRRNVPARVGTEILPEWSMCQWIYTSGFNKRNCNVAVKVFKGDFVFGMTSA